MKEKFGLFLDKLNLKNFATFEDQTIGFDKHFNAIIGETGSGKSLILDALQIILGQRADKKLIRKDCDYSVIEASFICHDEKIKEFFFEQGFPFDDEEIVIKRIIYKTGKTKSFLNHQNCSLAVLTMFSKKFIDLVGQFENQKLLSEQYQLQLLDNYTGNTTQLEKYQTVFQDLLDSIDHLNKLKNNFSDINQRLDYINYQIKELDTLAPSVEREEELLSEKRNFQKQEQNKIVIEQLNQIFEGGYEGSGLLGQLNQIESLLNEGLLNSEELNQFYSAREVLNDINYKINKSNSAEFDIQAFEQNLTELDLYQKMKRKFNVDTKGLVEVLNSFIAERDELDNIDKSIEVYEDRINKLKADALNLARDLHDVRLVGAKRLGKELTTEIQHLRMEGASIKIDLNESIDLNRFGLTQINLLAETNPGEGFFKVKEIASGGELSRILLSLRKVLATKDSISIFLFDEIDTGVGGETALCIGKTLGEVSFNSQVIAITHLPQIANFAQKLVVVSKEQINIDNSKRTISNVKEVAGENIKSEVTSMTPLS